LSALAKNKTKIVFYGKYLLFDGQFVVFLRKRRKVYLKINMWLHEVYSSLRCSYGGGRLRRVRPKFWILTEVLSWI